MSPTHRNDSGNASHLEHDIIQLVISKSGMIILSQSLLQERHGLGLHFIREKN